LVGVSAGAPFAVAAALALGERAGRLVLASAVADRESIRRHGGAVRLFHRSKRHTRLMRLVVPRLVRQIRHHGFDARLIHLVLRNELRRLRPEIDREEVMRTLLSSVRESLRPGVAGLMGDLELLTRTWGMDPGRLSGSTLILHGAADGIVPPAHAHWYARQIPRSELEIVEGEGHVSLLINHARRIIRAFASAP
jgi:pimeloyl-ACP methyl ester carboxylesterase